MKNPKLKRLTENIMLGRVLDANWRNISTVLIITRQLYGFGESRLWGVINAMAERSKEMGDADRDGCYEHEAQKTYMALGIPKKECQNIVARRNKALLTVDTGKAIITNEDLKSVLADNLANCFFALHTRYGFGKSRIKAIMREMLIFSGDGVEALKSFGITMADLGQLPDIESLTPKDRKISNSEAQEVLKKFDMIKKYIKHG